MFFLTAVHKKGGSRLRGVFEFGGNRKDERRKAHFLVGALRVYVFGYVCDEIILVLLRQERHREREREEKVFQIPVDYPVKKSGRHVRRIPRKLIIPPRRATRLINILLFIFIV